MATEFNEQYHRDIITLAIDGIPYSGWLVHCCPGDWPAIRAEMEPHHHWLELRCGNCLIALGEFSASALGTGDVARDKDMLSTPRPDRDRSV